MSTKKLRYAQLEPYEKKKYVELANRFNDPQFRGDAVKADENYRKANSLFRALLTGGTSIIWYQGKGLFYALKCTNMIPGLDSRENAKCEYYNYFLSLQYKHKCKEVEFGTFPNCPWKIDFEAEHEKQLRAIRGEGEWDSFSWE